MGGRVIPPFGGVPGGVVPPGVNRALRRLLFTPLLLIVAGVGQLAVVNRAPLPGGGGTPDLVLLVVAALGVDAGPMIGLLAGFASGLAIDVAPPGGHLAGEYALVYCLVGYGCGRIRDLVQGSSNDRSMRASLTVMAIGVAAGEAGKAALGLMLSDPNMTGPAIRHVLPAAVIYDLLLCPFVLWLVLVTVGRPLAEGAPEPRFPQAFRLAPAFRLASAGAAPGLRLAGSSPLLVPLPVRSEPRLRFASGRSHSLSRTNSAFSSTSPAVVGGRASRPVKIDFASARTPARGSQRGGASALRAAGVSGFQRKSPGKGWLRPGKPAGTAVHHPASPAKGWARGDPPSARPARRPASPGKGWARGVSGRAMPAAPVRRQASPGKGWVRPAGQPKVHPWRRQSPGRGWLRPVRPAPPPRRRSPGRGWLESARPAPPPRRQSPGKGWARGDLRTVPVRRPGSPGGSASPGRGWLRVSPAVAPPGWRRQSPGRGWLRPARPVPPPRRSSPGKGWLRPAKPLPAPHRRSPGRGWIRPSKPLKQNWYTRSPSTRWLRRGRRRRLLLGGRR